MTVLIVSTALAMNGTNSILAQSQPFAAVLRVIQDSLEIQRANAVNTLPLPPNSQSGFGVGDLLRTGTYGRAIIEFGAARLLVLPQTEIMLDDYSGSNGSSANTLALTLTRGRVFFVRGGASFDALTIHAGTITLDQAAPDASVGLEVLANGTSTIIAGVSSSGGTVNGEAFTLEEGEGVRSDPVLGDSPPTAITAPYNFARLDSFMNGCPGDIQARGEASLNVRVGPGLDFDALGSIPNETRVFLMATNTTGERYRVQFLSGYGWVLANGVRHRCTDLTVLPNNSVENIVRLLYATPEELEILFPFYGTPEDDEIFYILPQQEAAPE